MGITTCNLYNKSVSLLLKCHFLEFSVITSKETWFAQCSWTRASRSRVQVQALHMIRSVTTKQRPNRVIHIDGYNAQKPPPLMESLISTPISCCFFVLLRYGSWNESVTHRTGIETTGRGLSCFPPSPRLLPCLRRDAFAPETIVLIVVGHI